VGSGQSRLFRARHEHPLAAVLDAVFRAEDERFEAVLQAVREAVDACGTDVLAAWLYGSVARGDDSVSSDVDIALVAAPEALASAADAVRERLRPAEDALAFTASVVGLDTEDVPRLGEGDPWWAEVVRDAIVLVGDDPEALAARLHRERRSRAKAGPR